MDLTRFRYAFKRLKRRPIESASVSVLLGVACGVLIAATRLTNVVTLSPIPYPSPSRLVVVYGAVPSSPDSAAWLERIEAFEVAADYSEGIALPDGNSGGPLRVAEVGARFLELVGTVPLVGRGLLRSDAFLGAEPVTLLSYDYWVSRHGADRSIIGQRIRVDFIDRVVIGVLPRNFHWLSKIDVWVPSEDRRLAGQLLGWPAERGPLASEVILARLKPGVSADQAATQVQTAGQKITPAVGGPPQSSQVVVVPLIEAVRRNSQQPIWLLFHASSLLVLLASANALSIALADGWRRRDETATRIVLGASNAHIARMAVREGVLLALPTICVALVVALACIRIAGRLVPVALANLGGLQMDAAFVTLVAVVTVAVCLGVALLGAICGSYLVRRRSSTVWSRDVGSLGVDRLLVVVQISVCVALSIVAGLVLKSVNIRSNVDLGYQPKGVYLADLTVPALDRSRSIALATGLDDIRESQKSAVLHVAVASAPPSSPSGATRKVTAGESGTAVLTSVTEVTGGYFSVLQIGLRAGRDFTSADVTSSAPVAIINTALVEALGLSADPAMGVGRSVKAGSAWYQVIGVVAATSLPSASRGRTEQSQMYIPFGRLVRPPVVTQLAIFIVPRRNGQVNQWQDAFERRRLGSISNIRSLDSYVWRGLTQSRARRDVLTVVAGIAVLVNLIGVFASTRFAVELNLRSIAIKMALGASQRHLTVRHVTKNTRQLLIGTVCGSLTAYLLTKSAESMIYGVRATDYAVYGVSIALVWLPTWLLVVWVLRSTRVADPASLLKST